MKNIKVTAPATVANVSCGFDIMGFSVENIGDELSLTLSEDYLENKIEVIGEYGHLIPADIKKNTASVAIDFLLKTLGREDVKYAIVLKKKLPLGSGMGSSASSSAAGVFAMNELLGKPYSIEELIPFAMEGERIACGAAHADNVAPSLLGGFVLVRSYSPLDVVKVPCPEELFSVVVCPEIELHTKDARRILFKEIEIEKSIQQSANAAGFILGILTQNYELIKRSMVDVIAEPKRMQLIPGFEAIKKQVAEFGALGCGISGSGPSIFALCKGRNQANEIKTLMIQLFEEMGIESNGFVGKLNSDGVKIINEEQYEIL